MSIAPFEKGFYIISITINYTCKYGLFFNFSLSLCDMFWVDSFHFFMDFLHVDGQWDGGIKVAGNWRITYQ